MSTPPSSHSQNGCRVGSGRARLGVEVLEAREVPATFTVGTSQDTLNPLDGVLSLREAIHAANANAGEANTINFAHALVGPTVTLESQLPTITGTVTIEGVAPPEGEPVGGGEGGGPVVVVVAGGSITIQRDTTKANFRLMEVAAGAVVTLSDLILKNGKSAARGGAILSAGNLTITDCELRDNEASQGGAIATLKQDTGVVQSQSRLTITDSLITNNTATAGGGIHATDTQIEISGSQITYNTATFTDGGGIFATDTDLAVAASVSLANTTVAGNTAVSHGGGVACLGKLYLYAGTTIAYNTLSGEGGQGGGIYVGGDYGRLIYDTPTIALNTAASGDGAYLAAGVVKVKMGPESVITYVDDTEVSYD